MEVGDRHYFLPSCDSPLVPNQWQSGRQVVAARLVTSGRAVSHRLPSVGNDKLPTITDHRRLPLTTWSLVAKQKVLSHRLPIGHQLVGDQSPTDARPPATKIGRRWFSVQHQKNRS